MGKSPQPKDCSLSFQPAAVLCSTSRTSATCEGQASMRGGFTRVPSSSNKSAKAAGEGYSSENDRANQSVHLQRKTRENASDLSRTATRMVSVSHNR